MILNCTDSVPTSEKFFNGLTEAEQVLVIVCGVLTIIDIIILIDNIIFIWRKHNRLTKAVITTTWLLGLCPTLAVIALMAMVVPNAYLFREVIIAVCLSIVMYKFIQLLAVYATHYENVREQIVHRRIHFNVRPVCCLCLCFPTAKITRLNLRVLRALVLQYPLIMVLLTVITMFTWLDGKYIPGSWKVKNVYPYLSVLRIMSVLTALYSLNVLVALCVAAMKCFYINQKFIVLSFSITCFNVQNLMFNYMSANGVFKKRGCFSAHTMGNFYENITYCLEMFILTLLNLWFYRRPPGPPPDQDRPFASTEDLGKALKGKKVTVVDETHSHASTSFAKPFIVENWKSSDGDGSCSPATVTGDDNSKSKLNKSETQNGVVRRSESSKLTQSRPSEIVSLDAPKTLHKTLIQIHTSTQASEDVIINGTLDKH